MGGPEIIAASILGGTGLLSAGKGKKSAGDIAEAQSGQADAARLQAEIAQQLLEDVDPLRTILFGTPGNLDLPGGLGGPLGPGFELPRTGELTTFLETGELPTALQADVPFAAARDTLEEQFANVEQSLVEQAGARGGQLTQELGETARARGRAVGQLALQEGLREADLRERVFSQTLAAAFGAPPQAISGLAASSAGFGALAGDLANIQLQQGQALGQSAALAAKLALKQGGGAGSPTVGLPGNPIQVASGAPFLTPNAFGNLPVFSPVGP